MRITMRGIIFCSVLASILMLSLIPPTAKAQGLPKISVEVGESDNPQDLSVTLQIVLVMTVLALAPSIVMMLTSFTRIVVVLSFVRRALGTHQMPPAQLIVGLSLVLTVFIMAPVADRVHKEAIKPYLDGEISQQEAYNAGTQPLREFMLKQTREKDIALFVKFSGIDRPQSPADIPLHVLIPGFVISELRIAGHRHGCGICLDVDGDDDAATYHGGLAVQDSAVRAD
jgi:flagellar biosynthetic protein FliP